MPDTISSALGWALLCLRSAVGWTRARLSRAAGFDDSLLGRYERGEKITRETADVLARLLGRRPEDLDVQLFAHRLTFPEAWEEAASPVNLSPDEHRKINRATLAAGWNAAEAVRAELIRRKKKDKADAAMDDARKYWERLKAAPQQDRRDLVLDLPEFRTWPLALLACEASVRAAAHSAREALELAGLAVLIAQRVPEPESWRQRLEGFSWAYLGNARRVGNDFAGADAAFVQAWDLWRAGADADSELLPEWRMFDLEASLRAEERRFNEALDLLRRAQRMSDASPVTTARILLKREWVCDQMGDTEGALAALAEAAPFVEVSDDPQLLFVLRFNMVDNLCGLERYEEAAALLPHVRDMALEQAAELSLNRVLWLQSRVAAGQGQPEKAIAALLQVQGAFLERDLPYDAALASLDLALLWLRTGRTAEVQELAVTMDGIFKARGIHREATAALRLFCEAAKQRTVTEDLARSVMAQIKEAKRLAAHQ